MLKIGLKKSVILSPNHCWQAGCRLWG